MKFLIEELRNNTDFLFNEINLKESIHLVSPITVGQKKDDIKKGELITLKQYYDLIIEAKDNVENALLAEEFGDFLHSKLPMIENKIKSSLVRQNELVEELIAEYLRVEKRVAELQLFHNEYHDKFLINKKLANFMLPFYKRLIYKLKQKNQLHVREYEMLLEESQNEIVELFESADAELKRELLGLVENTENIESGIDVMSVKSKKKRNVDGEGEV